MGMLSFTFFNMLQIAYVVHKSYADEGPSFVYHPANRISCIEGQECMLVCTVKNLKSGTLKWQRNNVFVSILNRDKYEETTIKTSSGETQYLQNNLHIRNIERSDANYFYRCVATEGKIFYSSNGTLQVTEVPSPHYPHCTSKRTYYSIGESAEFVCTSEKTQNSRVTLHWFKNNIPVNNAIQHNKNNEIISKLTVQVTGADKGSVFVCHQQLDVSVTLNKSCTIGPLDITFGPKISISGPRSIPLNGEALYVCSSTGNPPTSVNEWLRPQLPQEAYTLENHRQVLRILKATLNMNGTVLRCIAENNVGRVEEIFTLIVESMNDRVGKPPRQPINQPTEGPLPVAQDISKILTVAGMCLLITAVLIGLVLCYLQFCKFGFFPVTTNEERIAQPEVYFEPKDNIRCMMSPYDDNGMYYKRNVAVQVTPGVDTDSVYAEVEEGKKI